MFKKIFVILCFMISSSFAFAGGGGDGGGGSDGVVSPKEATGVIERAEREIAKEHARTKEAVDRANQERMDNK